MLQNKFLYKNKMLLIYCPLPGLYNLNQFFWGMWISLPFMYLLGFHCSWWWSTVWFISPCWNHLEVRGGIQVNAMLDNSSVLQMSDFRCLNIAACGPIIFIWSLINSARSISSLADQAHMSTWRWAEQLPTFLWMD